MEAQPLINASGVKPPVYISGPMTGIPDDNIPLFNKVAAKLQEHKIPFVNPPGLHDMDGGNTPWRDYLRIDIAAMMGCRSIILLPDWVTSRGVRKELEAAWGLDFLFFELREGGFLYDMTEFEVKQVVEEYTKAKTPVKKETILEEAQRIVHGDRNKDYGHPAEDFTRTGRIWGALLGVPDIEPAKVGMMMVGLKMSRECNREKRDNLVDGAGYFETVSMVREYLKTHPLPNPNNQD